jgi:hypothetical protein
MISILSSDVLPVLIISFFRPISHSHYLLIVIISFSSSCPRSHSHGLSILSNLLSSSVSSSLPRSLSVYCLPIILSRRLHLLFIIFIHFHFTFYSFLPFPKLSNTFYQISCLSQLNINKKSAIWIINMNCIKVFFS